MAKKRGQNEGTICKRQDGRWCGALTLGYKQRKFFYGRTAEEVRRKIKEAQRRHDQGLPISDDNRSLGSFLDTWLSESVRPAVRPKTFIGYERDVRLHIKPELGNVPLSKITPDLIQKLLNQKLKEGLSPASVCHIHAVLRKALGQAVRWEKIVRNSAKLVDPPRIPKKEPRSLTPDQARAFLKAADGDRLGSFYNIAMLGLRINEITALRWEDINFEKGTIRIVHQLQRAKGGGWELTEPKSRAGRRTIGLPEIIADGLRSHRKNQLEEKMRARSKWQEHGFIFTSDIGTPLNSDNISKRSFKPLLKRAGLPDFRFHDLRISSGTFLALRGVHPKTAQEILGHSDIRLTMSVYTAVLPELKQNAAREMNDLLFGE